MVLGQLLSLLRDRAAMLEKVRGFFKERKVLEVDCCALNPRAAIDSNIDVIEASILPSTIGFLQTSPEYAMKRLLSMGSGDIYFLGHVFRKGDLGRLHSPEFTMAEWYRVGMSFSHLIEEACELLFLFIGNHPIRKIGYREAFQQYVGINYSEASLLDLSIAAKHFGAEDSPSWNRDSYLHFLLAHGIEPHFGRGELTVLIDYPPHEAALAYLIEKNGEMVAERFEIYFQGIELANGYHELADSNELRKRFVKENEIRKSLNKDTYLLDEDFLSALEAGFPDCCGVSVGIDRALMLRHKVQTLQEVLPFAWKLPIR